MLDSLLAGGRYSVPLRLGHQMCNLIPMITKSVLVLVTCLTISIDNGKENLVGNTSMIYFG